ncbi:MAG: hypothetical protein AB8G99_01835, partial [Planctomycetaceae bacterium]
MNKLKLLKRSKHTRTASFGPDLGRSQLVLSRSVTAEHDDYFGVVVCDQGSGDLPFEVVVNQFLVS